MSHFFFFALGFGCAITGCWVHHQLQEIGIALADNNDCDCDEHEGLTK
jgi:hypothetical protein